MRRTDICYSCRHWLGQGVRERGPKGQCRRFPPVVTDRAPQGSFPITDSGDWCGEWLKGAVPVDSKSRPQARDAAEGATLYDDL